MEAYQERVVAEEAELREKYDKLCAFLQTPAFDNLHRNERSRLISQVTFMRGYWDVLRDRIFAFQHGEPS